MKFKPTQQKIKKIYMPGFQNLHLELPGCFCWPSTAAACQREDLDNKIAVFLSKCGQISSFSSSEEILAIFILPIRKTSTLVICRSRNNLDVVFVWL